MTLTEVLKTLPQYCLPQHSLSRVMRSLSRCENPAWKNLFIRQIIKHYGVDMNEALEADVKAYKNFNEFFTRALKPGIRPVCQDHGSIASPADGAVSQAGRITGGKLLQAKGKNFTVLDLLGGDPARAAAFEDGSFATIYLSPKDYHRLHMPLTGTLKEMVHIPGKLFSVNTSTTNAVPGLFARNERVVALFDTEAGPMALVLVGAIFVCSIETVWHGEVTPPTRPSIQAWQYLENPLTLDKGQEMGRFNMGSTIIVLFGKGQIEWESELCAGKQVLLGEKIGVAN
ncbi:MAG: phosphatidylserine decarboxylase [Methylobacter sp.]|nr:MAG: phosphatidylserine decarboxylase [Methylobacter sp.]PPD21187.1 MAG: phosphatidylserine decarboxylase [Methylobacter sp.]